MITDVTLKLLMYLEFKNSSIFS